MSFAHSEKAISPEYAVKITDASFVDNRLTIHFEIDPNVEWQFLRLTDEDGPFFNNGRSFQHTVYKHERSMSFIVYGNFPFEKARICLFDHAYEHPSPGLRMYGILKGKSDVIKNCLKNQVASAQPLPIASDQPKTANSSDQKKRLSCNLFDGTNGTKLPRVKSGKKHDQMPSQRSYKKPR